MNAMLQVVTTETHAHQGATITLVQDAAGFWGYIVGDHICLPIFRYRTIALDDAKRHIDGRQR
jgi:hypothetical protein